MENWIKNLAIKAIHICRLNKEAVGNHRQDMTRPILEDLINDGYQAVQWNSGNSTHSECLDLNHNQWPIKDFISGLEHDAPMFEKSHPGCSSCSVTVSGEGKPPIELDSFGDTDAAIGTSSPVKAPSAPKVIQKVLAPTPETKVVEKPVQPEKVVRYVPKEVHKQMKDPFENSEQDKEDWLKDLEKENVEESIPEYKPTEEDVEEWNKDLERETSLKKIKPWIYGIFK
jgi:hypothetical protein